MNDRHIDHLLTQHRKHLAHQQRELYHHNIDDPCPCDVCQRGAFEHRAVMVALGLVVLLACFAWVFFLVPK